MKRLFQLVVALVLSSVAVFGQAGACYYDRVNDTNGKAVQYPQVQVCSPLASGNPCTPKSTLFSDAALTHPIANPFTGDSRGNIVFCAAVGVYTVQFLPGTQSTITYSEVSLPIWSVPAAGITNIATSSPLFGGPITTTGTISCPTCEVTTNKDQPNGYAGLSAGSKISGTEQTYGTTANTAVEGNDSRIVGAVQSSRLINTTSPLAGGGDLSADRTLTCLTCVVAPVSPGAGVGHFAGGTQTITSSAVIESDQSLSDVTTANVSTARHGYAPKLPNDATVFLNGVGGYTTPTFTSPHYFPYGGSGLDGALAFDGVTTIPCASLAGSTYTLTRECYATTIVVSAGVTINTNTAGGKCYIIFAYTSITINGTIQSVGTAGGNGAGANGGASGQQVCRGATTDRIGTLTSNNTNTTAPTANSGGSGAVGVGNNGNNGTNTNGGGSTNYCPAGASSTGAGGGNGGAGGSAGGTGGTGGTGGGTTPGIVPNMVNDGHTIWSWRDGTSSASVYGQCYYNGAAGGGAGGGGNGVQSGGTGGGGGGSGGGGGMVFISSPIITVGATGLISADGGAGGNGGNAANGAAGGTATGGGGGGGGGSGGPGGFAVLVYHTYTNGGAVHANGGAAGAVGTKGTGTAGGVNGVDGSAGAAGKAGVVFQFAF